MTKNRLLVFSRLAALGVAILVASSAIAQDYGEAVKQGLTLTPAGAEKIENSLIADPHDLDARAQLLGYYSARVGQVQAARGARLRHIEWLVRNQPASLLLRNRSVRLQASDFAPPYGGSLESLRGAWKDQAGRHPNDALVIENAWESLGGVEFGINGRGVSSAEYVTGRTSAEYLKRLRVLEPGDPEWAFDLASVYTLAVVRGAQSDAALGSKMLGGIILAELEKSDDAAVVGWTGAAVYLGRRGAREPVSESLLRRAAALNPKNPAWARAIGGAVPASTAEFAAALTGFVQETDLWPRGVVRMMNVPPGAIRMTPADEAARRPPLTLDLTSPAVAPVCSARFDALIERDGRIKNLQVVAFDHLYIPFIHAARDALRQVRYSPMLVDGQPVEIVTEIDVRCPTRPKQVAIISQEATPPARGMTVGHPEARRGDAAPPPKAVHRVSSEVQAAKLIKRPARTQTPNDPAWGK